MLCWNMSLVSSSRASCFHVHASRAPGVRRRPLLSLSISKHSALNINIKLKQPGRVGVGNQNTLSTSAGSLLHLKYQNRRHSRRQGMLKFSAFGPRSAASLLLTAGRQDQQQRFVSTVSSACVPNRNFANWNLFSSTSTTAKKTKKKSCVSYDVAQSCVSLKSFRLSSRCLCTGSHGASKTEDDFESVFEEEQQQARAGGNQGHFKLKELETPGTVLTGTNVVGKQVFEVRCYCSSDAMHCGLRGAFHSLAAR